MILHPFLCELALAKPLFTNVTETEELTFRPSDNVDALTSTDSCLYISGCVCTRNHNIWQWKKK